jgi:hypothetical protein
VTFEEYTRHIDWSLTVSRRRTRQTGRQAASTMRELAPTGDPDESGRAALLDTPANRDDDSDSELSGRSLHVPTVRRGAGLQLVPSLTS